MQRLPSLLAASALFAAALPAWSQPAADVAAGKRAYMAAGCYQCHGTIGHGGVGPKLAPNPLPAEALIAFVRYTSRNMPAYSPQVVSDQDLRLIHAYLASIPATPEPGPH
jgi:ubiquinol-cytochrome c reductase cytochrome c subunit